MSSANRTSASPSCLARAILDGDYDGALRALERGRSPTEPVGGDGPHAKAHAVTLLARHPVPIAFAREFLSRAAALFPDSLDEFDGDNRSSLGYALEHADKDLLALLLEAGADPSERHLSSRSAFQIAADRADAAILSLLHDRGKQYGLRPEEAKLVAQFFDDGGMQRLVMLFDVSAAYRREIMRHTVDAVSRAVRSRIPGRESTAEQRKMHEIITKVYKLDTRHEYQLLLRLIRSGHDSARQRIESRKLTFSPSQLRIIRRAAADANDKYVHEWASKQDFTLQETNETSELNDEMVLALLAGNGPRADALLAKGASSETLHLPAGVTLPALLAGWEEDRLRVYLASSAIKSGREDLLCARSGEALSRLLQHCNVNEALKSIPRDNCDLALKAVELDNPDLLQKLFALNQSLRQVWDGLQLSEPSKSLIRTPLKAAIRLRSEKMVQLLLELGSVPIKAEIELAREYSGAIESLLQFAYLALPEGKRF